ncbi:MAG: hypothetical protein SWN10_13595 [Pseudomonadota bacterium]|nr:hypothetical protein [Pseudomonadota bacterium]
MESGFQCRAIIAWGIHGQYHFLPTAIPGTRDGRVEVADWFDTEGQFIHPESSPY